MNRWRRPTAEAIFENHHFYQAKSAGISAAARIRLSEKLIHWADLIFVMEKNHKQRITEHFESSLAGKEIVVLYIDDDYTFMDPELVEIIKLSVRPYLVNF